jgi:tetratricopeptide (TPR) repeat protein
MKKIAVLAFSILFSLACDTASQRAVSTPPQNQNTVLNPPQGNQVLTSKPDEKSKWTQSGNPIDTKEFDDEIAAAEKNLKAKPKDETAKKALAESYFKRGVALTDARQYASALGDYRRALKLDPTHADAKKWIQQIIDIYDGLNKEYPKEGEEPPPIPFKKGA